MSRLIAIVFVLAEINFRCVPTSACDDDNDENCMESMDSETEGETEQEGEAEGEADPMPDLGG